MLVDLDIVKIVVNQRYVPSGKPITNVFYYRALDVVGDIEAAEDFAQIAADVMLGMRDVVGVYQTDDVNYDGATFENLTNGVDIGAYVPPDVLPGSVTGATEPLQVALSFKLIRSTRLTRNGSKRFGGIADSFVNDATGAGIAGTAATIAIQEWLKTPIDVVPGGGLAVTLQPVIIRKTAAGVPPTVINVISDAVYRGAGSQNSRKELL